MSPEPEPSEDQPVDAPTAEPTSAEEGDQDIGDFVTRQILEKDSVFFEG